MIVQVLNNTGGSAISSLAVGSGQTITTNGIDTRRTGTAGMFLVFTGSVIALTRQVSYDNTTFYTPYDKNSSLANCMITSANNSRYISLDMVISDSGNIVSPFTRYNITMLSGGTLSAIYVQDESI